jgi:hypothetical protein
LIIVNLFRKISSSRQTMGKAGLHEPDQTVPERRRKKDRDPVRKTAMARGRSAYADS